MDQAERTMQENLAKNTGKTLEQWVDIVSKEAPEKHGQIIAFLKEKHGFTHGYANYVALKSRGTDAGSAKSEDDLIEKQYKGKEHFRPLFDKLMQTIQTFGPDVEVAPKNAYVSLRRKKQFAILQPATKTRFEIGINLKGQPADGMLEAITSANAMCSHKMNLSGADDVTEEVLGWLKKAYDGAG